MTGPPYPRVPVPGSNTIGSFQIGVSPVGDISPFDVWTTVLSQYANSPILTALLTNMAQYVDRTRDLDSFFDTIWNVNTAVGVGLDIWGRIVGVSRVLQLPAGAGPFLGFEEAGTPTTLTPFGQAPFFSGQAITTNFALSDAAFRMLILVKALANICDGSIPAINQLLINLFPGQGSAFIADGLNMTMTYTFSFVPTPAQLAIISSSGALPRTTGVAALIVHP